MLVHLIKPHPVPLKFKNWISKPIIRNRKITQKLDLIVIEHYMEEPPKCSHPAPLLPTPPHPHPLPLEHHLIVSRCKVDHLSSPRLPLQHNVTSYNSTFTPPETHPLPQSPYLHRELSLFRKHQNSSNLHLPAITDKTQYQQLYNGQPHSKILRSTQKDSWFLKAEWPQKLTSSYQKDFSTKPPTNCNSLNKLRVNYNNLQVFDLQASPKGMTQYQQQFRIFKVKPQLKLAIGNKDHLNGKQNSYGIKERGVMHKKYQSELNVGKGELLYGSKLKIMRHHND